MQESVQSVSGHSSVGNQTSRLSVTDLGQYFSLSKKRCRKPRSPLTGNLPSELCTPLNHYEAKYGPVTFLNFSLCEEVASASENVVFKGEPTSEMSHYRKTFCFDCLENNGLSCGELSKVTSHVL
jgi:hypothetical protein